MSSPQQRNKPYIHLSDSESEDEEKISYHKNSSQYKNLNYSSDIEEEQDEDYIEMANISKIRKRSGRNSSGTSSVKSTVSSYDSTTKFGQFKDNESLYDDNPQLTIRAVIVGCLLGTLISASNFYIGLRLGWTFGAGIFGSIFGYSIISFLAKAGIGGAFTPKEHATLSSVATAAGSGTLAGYISGIPAMYRLGLLTDVQADLGKIAIWSLAASLYGIFFAIPLRKWFVLKQKLPFPSPTATAEIIKSLHIKGGEHQAKKKTKALLFTLVFSMTYLIFAWFVPVIKSWHILYWIGNAFDKASVHYTNLIEGDKWNFYISLSWAFIGAGLMTPLNTAVSTNVGSVLAWGIIGPILLASGTAPGDRHQMKGTMVNGTLVGVTELPTARYWLLWPGLFMMIAASFTELACRGKMLVSSFSSFGASVIHLVTRKKNENSVSDSEYEDPSPEHEQVPMIWWVPGLIIAIVLSICVLNLQFGVSVGQAIFAIILGFFFAFVGLQSAGETDINPTGTIAKATQIIFSALPPYNPTGAALAVKQTANLSAGLVSASAASQAVDMVSDLKTGHIIGAAPRSQFLGQLIGSIFGAGVGLGFWRLFTAAYPCIISTSATADAECAQSGFSLQAVTAWQGITMALTKKNSIPESSLIAAIVVGCLTIFIIVLKNTKIPEKYRPYVPNMNAIGISFVNTDPSLFFAMLVGSVASMLWQRRSPTHHEMYMYAIASGLIAGEGIFGLVSAMLNILNVKEGTLTKWGMP